MPDVVSYTGPLIALASIDQFELLQKLFGKVYIPPALLSAEQRENRTLARFDQARMYPTENAARSGGCPTSCDRLHLVL